MNFIVNMSPQTTATHLTQVRKFVTTAPLPGRYVQVRYNELVSLKIKLYIQLSTANLHWLVCDNNRGGGRLADSTRCDQCKQKSIVLKAHNCSVQHHCFPNPHKLILGFAANTKPFLYFLTLNHTSLLTVHAQFFFSIFFIYFLLHKTIFV